MIFFTVKQDFVINLKMDNNQINLNFEHNTKGVDSKNIYISSLLETNYMNSKYPDIFTIIDNDKISHLVKAKELGVSYKNSFKQILSSKESTFSTTSVNIKEQLKSYKNKSITIALLGSFGAGIGDLISSLPAFRIFIKTLQRDFDEIFIDIYIYAMYQSVVKSVKAMFKNERVIRDIKPLPLSINELNAYDFYINTIFFMQDDKSSHLNITDFSLYKLGIDYIKIKDEDKLFNINIQEDIFYLIKAYIKQKANNKTVVLFHPSSSTYVRSIPIETSCLILNTLLSDENIFVVSAVKLDYFIHDRFLDMSNLSLSIEHFFSIIKSVDFCVSSDTSIYHIGANTNTPTLAIFTTIQPEIRIKYYKNVYAMYIANDAIKNIHNEESIEENIKVDMDEVFHNFDIVEFINIVDIIKKTVRI